jgi:hypothetical protein
MSLMVLAGCTPGAEDGLDAVHKDVLAQAATVDGEHVELGEPRCGNATWCWEHGRPINDIHGRSDDSVFAVGPGGGVIEWKGDRWVTHDPFTTMDIMEVWVAAPNDVWVATADRSVWHYDGKIWTRAAVRGGGHFSGSGPGDVWLGTRHLTGTTWREWGPELGLTADVHALGPNDVWAVGYRSDEIGNVDRAYGCIMRQFDGQRWTQVGSPITTDSGCALLSVHGQIRVISTSQTFRFDGATWVPEDVEWGRPTAGLDDDPATLEYLLPDGDGYVRVPYTTGCVKATRIDADTWFCYGENGEIRRFTGTEWAAAPHDRYGATLSADEWGTLPPAVWAGDARLAWGTGPTDVWRVRPNREIEDSFHPLAHIIEHFDGNAWREYGRSRIGDIAGSASDDVWFVGDQLLHWDGLTLREVRPPRDLGFGPLEFHKVHTLGAGSTVFVASIALEGSYLLHYADERWSVLKESAEVEFVDVTGTSIDSLWLLAQITEGTLEDFFTQGVLYARRGGRWDEIALWPVMTFEELTLAGGRLWMRELSQVYSVAIDDLAGLTALTEIDPRLSVLHPSGQDMANRSFLQLWVDSQNVWLSNADHAVRRVIPRP